MTSELFDSSKMLPDCKNCRNDGRYFDAVSNCSQCNNYDRWVSVFDGSKNYCNEKLNLEHLAEEASEVCQAKSKLIRFGGDDTHPDGGQGRTKRRWLANEIGNFLAIVDILLEKGTITQEDIDEGKCEKLHKLKTFY